MVLLMPLLFECDHISTNTPNFMRIDVVKCAWTRVVLARMGDPIGSHPFFFFSQVSDSQPLRWYELFWGQFMYSFDPTLIGILTSGP